MSITSTLMRSVLVASLLATGAVLGGCEGDDGLDGQDGAQGPAGPAGPAGPEGPPGVVTTKPLESCGVCHDGGSAYDAVAAHAPTGQMAVSDVAFAVNGADLVVSFNLKVDGADATDYNEISRDYRFAGGERRDLSTDGTPATLSGGAGGDYTITIAGGAVYAATDSRYLFRVQNPTGRPSRALIVGNFPDSPVVELASDQACIGCHGDTGQGFHYGYPMGSQQCVVCHNASNTDYPRLVELAHGIHGAHDRPSGHYEFDGEVWETTYPTYMTNCSVCHDSPDALAAANAMPVTGAGCFTCHESMEAWDFTVTGTTFHEAYDETTNCGTCHNNNVAPRFVTAFHNGIVTERGGIIWDGADTSVTEGAKFTWTITGVVDDGTDVAVSWEATYNGAAVDPCNATAGPGAPVFDGDDAGNLSILYTYRQGEDPILGTASSPGQASSVNLDTGNTTCAGGVATTTITPDRVEGATVASIALQGKPRVISVADPAELMQVRAKTPTYNFVVGSGLEADARREIVDTAQCLQCHVGSLYQHGGNRVDNVDMCIICHNSASNEQNVRVGMGVEASEAYDGKAGQTYEFKSMLHAIHSAGDRGDANMAPIVIYRNRGIYAWAESRDMLANWPGEGPQIVFGSNDVTQNHNFHNPTYPRRENDCAACHSAGFESIVPDQAKAMATTLEAGADPWNNQLDDVLQGAGAAACTSCHSDAAAKGHAYQNGWTPTTFENGRQTIIDATK